MLPIITFWITAIKQHKKVGIGYFIKIAKAEGLYTDADLQMAGYAAALKVLTSYSNIDGKDMVTESEAPKQAGKKSFVEELIDFAVQTAVQFLVPVGFEKDEWQKLTAIERFYLKMTELEHQGEKSLDNYQNFAKAFKVKDFNLVMSDTSRANSARLMLSSEFRGTQMSGDGELSTTPLRSLLYAQSQQNLQTRPRSLQRPHPSRSYTESEAVKMTFMLDFAQNLHNLPVNAHLLYS